MRKESFDFAGAGGDRLAGLLQRPDGEPAAYALFAHCFTCGKDVRAAAQLARSLAELGIATLRFDFTGLGASGGDFARTTFTSNVQDLVAAADALRERHSAPRLLIGHSLGGAAVLARAVRRLLDRQAGAGEVRDARVDRAVDEGDVHARSGGDLMGLGDPRGVDVPEPVAGRRGGGTGND